MRVACYFLITFLTLNASSEAAKKLVFEPYVFTANDGQMVAAELGRLTVPENRNNPGSHEIELALVRFRATSPDPGPPIVYLAGGPGGAGIETAQGIRFPLFMALREVGDVFALDQRGTGKSQPNLTCPNQFSPPLLRSLSPDELLDLWSKKLRACADHWRSQGVDLNGYNTNESADDLETLRQELGVKQIRLWGISYGTHLALAAIKRHGNSVHSAVLAGIEGPDHTLKLPGAIQKKLTRIDQMIRADSEASSAVPDFLGSIKNIAERLDRKPVTEEITDLRTGQTVKVEVNAFDFKSILAKNLDPASLPLFPQAFYDMNHGNFRTLAHLTLGERQEGLGSAMAYAMDCASGVSEKRWKRIQSEEPKTLLGKTIDFPFPEICESIGVPDLGVEFRSPVRSDVPVLFISGTLDQRTPARNASEVSRGFPNSSSLIIENGGHDDLFQSSPLILQVILKFLMGLPLSSRRIQLQPIRFLPVNTQ